jgi:hypothetical protein
LKSNTNGTATSVPRQPKTRIKSSSTIRQPFRRQLEFFVFPPELAGEAGVIWSVMILLLVVHQVKRPENYSQVVFSSFLDFNTEMELSLITAQ